MKSMFEIFSEIPDDRRSQGIRFPLPTLLTMILLGYIAGRYSGKSLGRYFKNNEEEFVKLFALQHGVPGSTKINTFLKSLDFNVMCSKFHQWTAQFNKGDKWVAIDGKVLRQTVANPHNSKHDFLTMVGAFSRESGVGLHYDSFENKEGNESATARELIQLMKDKGYIFTLDAAHCQKKRSKLSWSQEMIM